MHRLKGIRPTTTRPKNPHARLSFVRLLSVPFSLSIQYPQQRVHHKRLSGDEFGQRPGFVTKKGVGRRGNTAV